MNRQFSITNLTNLLTILSFFAVVFLIACDGSETPEVDPCEDFALSVSGSETEITLTITEGAAPYSIEVVYTGGTTQSESTSSSPYTFGAEVYEGATITLTDASGCETTATIADGVLSDPCEDFDVSVSGSGTQITFNITEGTAPFDYEITYDGGTTQSGTTSAMDTVIEATAYTGATVIVTDASDCSQTSTLNDDDLTDPCTDFAFTATPDDEKNIDFAITAGTAPYSYVITYLGDQIQDGTLTTATASITADHFESGTVTLTDAKGCEAEAVTLADACEDFSFEVEVLDDGKTIEFDIDGGVAPFDYVITYDSGETQEDDTSDRGEEIEADYYEGASIELTDDRGCEAEVQELEDGDLDPCVGFEVTAIGSDGEITLTIEGGLAPFDYTITYDDGGDDTDQTGSTNTGLSIALEETVYETLLEHTGESIDATIVVTDANGCGSDPVEVSEEDLTSLLDARGGEEQRYDIVKIGDQIWLAENFNYNDGTGVCYADLPANCDEYGKLYTWTAARAVDFAPDGWRLPTNDEAISLEDFLGDTPGTKLKEDGGSGFESKLGGGKGTEFDFLGVDGIYWTGTEDVSVSGNSFRFYVTESSSSMFVNSSLDQTIALSVRLIKD